MFGADGKCVSRLHSAETWESGQPVTRPTKWAKHRIKMISGGGFASSEFCISTKPLRLEQQICENNAARIWIISTEYFFEVFANCSLFRRMPIVAGCSLIWLPRGHNNGDHDKDGSLEWSPSNSSYHQATVNQIALTQKHEPMGRRQQTRRGGNECEMSHFTFATFAFYPLQSSESFWGLRSSPCRWLTDCPRSSFTNCFISRGRLLKQGPERLSDVFHFRASSLL